jgi:hypothetical protein
VLVDGDGKALLGFVLTNYILVEEVFDLAWLGKWWPCSYRLCLLIVGDDLITNVDTLIADIDRWSSNEFLYLILRLTAERAAQCVISSSYHAFAGSSLGNQLNQSYFGTTTGVVRSGVVTC